MLRRVVLLTLGVVVLLSTAVANVAAASPRSVVRALAIQAHRELTKEMPGFAHVPILVKCNRHKGSRTGDVIYCSVWDDSDHKLPVITGFTHTSANLPIGITRYVYTPPAH